MGVATWDNRDVIDLVDVLSCHSYAKGVEAFRADLTGTQPGPRGRQAVDRLGMLQSGRRLDL